MPAYSPTAVKANVWDKGDYDAELISVKDGISKGQKTAGQETQTLAIRSYSTDGKERTVYDQIIFPSDSDPDAPHSLWKLQSLAKAIGKIDEFKAGTFQAADNIGATFRVSLKVDEQPGYETRNSVTAYKPRTGQVAGQQIKQEDIPF
jgi:hypothetical protein